MTKLITFVIAISLSGITVLSDYFIKKASLENAVWNKWLLLGGIIYALTALGWFFVMKNLKLSTIGVIYGVSCITLLTIVSVFIFNEKISPMEIIGILLGMSSIAILYKFA